jgi:hypothetical protein
VPGTPFTTDRREAFGHGIITILIMIMVPELAVPS